MPKFKVLIPLFCLVLVSSVFGQMVANSDATSSIEATLRAGNFNQALLLAESQLQRSPKNATLWTLKGIALSRLNRDKEALTAYNTALNISPDYRAALEGAAELEYKGGSSRAVPLLNRIVKLRPDEPTSHAMLGVTAYKQHDCASAVRHFKVSQQLIGSQPVALAQYGSCLIDLQLPGDAVAVFQAIQNLQPQDPHARYNLAVAQYSAHQPKDAIATLEPLLQAQPPDPDVLDPGKQRYYIDFATISFNHQSFQVGVDMVSAGLKRNPKAAPLYVARGILYIQLGQFEKGEVDFTTATQLDPGQTWGAVAEGLALVQQSNLDQALGTVRAQLKSHPKDAFLQYMQAQILFQQGADPETPQFKEAVAAAVLSTQLDPSLVLARDLLGNLYLKSGQLDKSIEQSRHALQQSPSDQEALYHLMQALRHNGKDTKVELPALVKRLAVLRQASRSQEASGARYRLYEPESQSQPDEPQK